MKLLIVEDDESLQIALCKGFMKLGYTVDSANDGEEALDYYFSNLYDLIVLDLNLPKIDGMNILSEVRNENKEIPILILSARNEVENKIAGLDNGANDYLAKPFHFGELEARVRALLRRKYKTLETVIEIGLIKIDTAIRKVFFNGEDITLSRKEYGILEYLALNKGAVIMPTKLIEHIWESDTDDLINSFKVHMSTLRKKLPDGTIKNTRGQGYYVE